MQLAVKNINYCASVVRLSHFTDLPNCDNVKDALIFGNAVIVSKDACAGAIGLFFPLETALSSEFLHFNNLFIKSELNVDPTKKGFFEAHGRVRAVKFRGHKSEGFWIPIESLSYLNISLKDLTEGLEFDSINGTEICSKYVSKTNTRERSKEGTRVRQPRLEDGIVPKQFRFHFDTPQLKKNLHNLGPEDPISITDKWHGTSAVFAKVLILKDLAWYERLLLKLGVKIQTTEYGLVWASRRMIKGLDNTPKANTKHYYSEDIWSQVAREIEPLIQNGMTIYGEIVGYVGAKQIQKGYTYGCKPEEHKFLIYRITQTNVSGNVLEYSWPQVKQFCQASNLEHVKEFYYGVPGEDDWSYATTKIGEDWREGLVEAIQKKWVERECRWNPKMPAEGIVLRIDRLETCESYKLKNYAFLQLETKFLDKGEPNMEEDTNE